MITGHDRRNTEAWRSAGPSTAEPPRGTNGDDNPHLFVYHWLNGNQTCYNGCGFVPRNEPEYTAGMTLPVNSTPVQFAIWHHDAAWWVGYNHHWIGSFPDTIWADQFKVTGLVQQGRSESDLTANLSDPLGVRANGERNEDRGDRGTSE
jgi:hypothetical protein